MSRGTSSFSGRVTVRRISIDYSPRFPQTEIHKVIRRFRFVVVVAHRRTGKTVCAVNDLIRQAVVFRGRAGRFGYIAPFLNQAKMIAWDYLKHFSSPIPGIKVNASELSVTLPNGSLIRIFGADNPDALRGGYFDCVVLDEVAQMKPEVWHEIVRPALADRKGKAVFIGTPKGQNVFKELYDRGLSDSSGEWKSLMYDVNRTGVIDGAELESLRAEMSENAFRQEFLCDFTAESDDVLIPIDLVSAAASRVYRESDYAFAPKVIGVDIARFGDDATVFFRRQGLVAFPPVVIRKSDNMAVADRLVSEIQDFGADAVFVDAGGGAGVIDRVCQLGFVVTEVPFGGKAVDERFLNRRMEMWQAMKDWLVSGGSIPDMPELMSDLSTPTFLFNAAGKQVLEPKDKIKDRLGRSTDVGDALALTFAAPVFPAGDAGVSDRVEYSPVDVAWG